MKKYLALVLAIVMVFTLAACGSGGGDTVGGQNANFDPANVNIEKDKLTHYKIAFTYYTFDDKLGSQFKAAIGYLCEAYNCEPVFFETGMGDEAISNLESVLAAGGIQGLISVGISPAQMEVAKKYNVPVVATCGFPSIEEEIKGVAGYDNFLGGVIDDDYHAGYRCIESLYDAGRRKLCFSGLTQGFVKSHDDRMHAMQDFVAAHPDMTLLAESYTLGQNAVDIATFNASFPEMDCIAFSAIGDAVYLALETEGLTDGRVKIAGVDISSQTGDYFKNGVQAWTCGGQYGTAMVAWAVLYNYLTDGTRIIADTKTPLLRPYIEINTYDDYVQYVQWVESPTPVYNADEIAQLIKIFNPSVSIKDYEDFATNYTLDNIISRRK